MDVDYCASTAVRGLLSLGRLGGHRHIEGGIGDATVGGGNGSSGTTGGRTSGGSSSGTTTGDSGIVCLAAIPDTVDFQTTVVNTVLTRSITLRNVCAGEIDHIVAQVTGADANLFRVLDCPDSLGSDSQATVNLQYQPLYEQSQSSASVTFSGTEESHASLNVFGEPVGTAIIPSQSLIDFGFVPLQATVVECTLVTNRSQSPVPIEGVVDFATNGGAFALATTDDSIPPNPFSLPVDLPGGSSTQICFSFTPPITQQYQGQATVETNDPSGLNPIVLLAGWGGGPQISCKPTRIDFGGLDAGASPPVTVPVLCTNTGTAIPPANLTLSPPLASPGVFTAAFDQNVNPYPLGGLGSGQSAQIDVTYTPTTQSLDLGTLTIRSNGGDGRDFRIPLSGDGL